MITLAQIKAARALLNWTQETLAKASSLSLPGINNLERGLTTPRKDTLTAIENALNLAGIEFIDTSGVRLKTPDFNIEMIEGPGWLARYDDDIMSVLLTSDDEILQFSCDERLWMVYGSSTNHHYVDHKLKVGFRQRILTPASADFISSPPEDYRLIAPEYFSRVSYQVYGNRLALILWEAQRVTLIKSQMLADAFRAQFELLWLCGKPISAERLKKLDQWEPPRK